MPHVLPQEVIRRKRDGGRLDAREIAWFVEGVANGAISDAQVAAFAMAVFFRGMDASEAADLTDAMARSGLMLDWRAAALPGPVLDKHSTGGIGDHVSLALAPLVASCGGFVPMIAGRGLGHTGGTVDKLEAIPGYRTNPDFATFQRVVREAGCAIVGQSAELAPADRRLYAIRDVTAAVESIPLITASILSKKLAAGLDALVMDVKTGSGAFMPTHDQSRALAQLLVDTGNAAGLPTRALITDMDQPLADCAGNAVEVRDAIEFLTGAHRNARLRDATLALAAEMLQQGGLAGDARQALRMLDKALASGAAAERFARMTAALGGPADIVENAARHLSVAPYVLDVVAPRDGYVSRIDSRALGVAVVRLGGGRTAPGAAIDHAVGLTDIAPVGALAQAAPLARIHARDRDHAEAAARQIAEAYVVADEPPLQRAVVLERIGG